MKNAAAILAFSICLAFAGCKKHSSDTPITHTVTKPAANLPADWKLAEADGGRLAIGMPPEWRAIDLTAGDFSKLIDTAENKDPAFKPVLEQSRAMAGNKLFKMFIARKPDAGIAFAPNANILAMPLPGGVTLDQAVEENIRQIKTITPTVGQSLRYQCVAGEGRVVDWHLTMGSVKLHDLAYFIMSGNRFVVLTWTIPDESYEKLKPDVERMMETFRSK